VEKKSVQKGIAYLGLVVVIVVILLGIVAFFFFFDRSSSNLLLRDRIINTISKEGVGPSKQIAKLGLSPCEGNEYFTVSPVPMDQFGGIIPLGELGPGGHNFPTEVIMFGMKRTSGGSFEDATIYSPGDIYITKMNGSNPNSKDERKGYGIEFAACEELRGGMGFTSLAGRLQKEFVEPFDFCQEHTVRGSAERGDLTYTMCEKSGLMIKVEAGEMLGGIEGKAKNTLNWGMYDLRQEPLPFANPGRWIEKILHTVCPLDYFTPELKTQLKSRLGNIYGNSPRTIEPICGEVEQDVPGTAQGAWFIEGTPVDPMVTSDQSKHLSLAHDNVDPTKPVFVIGYSQKDIEPQKYFFESVSSGFINRDFDEVIPGQVYCYDNLSYIHPDQFFQISILLTMPDENTLHLGKNGQNTCGTGPWDFSDYTVYER
jgi:hypothetical protein